MFILPVKREYPARHDAWVVYGLIAINVVIFLGDVGGTEYGQRTYGFVPADHGMLNYLTSLFLHGGVWHLVGNMIFLWIFGASVEDALGHALTFACYLLCGVFGTLVHYWADPESTVPCIGASGAISGIMGIYMILFARAKMDIMVFVWSFRVATIPTTSIGAIGAWLAEQVLFAWITWVAELNFGIGFLAHIGGFAAGAAIGLASFLLGLSAFHAPPYDVAGPTMVACPVCQANMRRHAGRFRCWRCRAKIRIDEDGTVHLQAPIARDRSSE